MELLIILTLLVIAAQTTYLTIQSSYKISHRKFYKPIFVDTSVLIDGRIVSVAQSGFITSTLYIPRSVVGELQFMADQADHDKRAKARHGLDVVSELQALEGVNVKIFADSTHVPEGVDNRLLKLAKRYGGLVCTIDYNLNKVAQVENIPVLNVNNLAMNLRMAFLPGEHTTIELTQKGNDGHQAVGHLPDGTMVVVEQASSMIGSSVEVEFIRSLQTAAGRMMFAKVVGAKGTKPLAQKQHSQKTQVAERVAKQRTHPKQAQKPQANAQTRPQLSSEPPKPVSNQRNQTAPKRPRQKTSKSREDDLVSLINSQ